jgi:hypothetical protein
MEINFTLKKFIDAKTSTIPSGLAIRLDQVGRGIVCLIYDFATAKQNG